MTDPTIAGRTALVTGVTSGIGLALAKRLLAEKAVVIGIGRGGPDRLAGLNLGDGFAPVVADLADRDSRAHAMRQVLRAHDRIDIVVNNAAEAAFDPVHETDAEQWGRLLEVNFVAAMDIVRAVLPRMPEGAHLINISSVTTRFLPAPRYAAYAVTKTALAEATGALRLELTSRRVKVSTVTPGLVDTLIYAKVPGFARTEAKLREQVPRWLAGDDVADAIVWLLTRPDHVVISDVTLLPSGQPR